MVVWKVTNITTHYSDITMDTMASQITSLTIVYLTVNWGADRRQHQSSLLAFGPVTRKIFPFDDVIMWGYLSNWDHTDARLSWW